MRRLLEQPGWEALDKFVLGRSAQVASELAVTECHRAILRAGGSAELVAFAVAVLQRIDLIPITSAVVRRAAELHPPSLRTLDAIHLATALEVGPIDALVTYDARLGEAARRHGLEVAAPS